MGEECPKVMALRHTCVLRTAQERNLSLARPPPDTGLATILWILLTWRDRDGFLSTTCLSDKEEMYEWYMNWEECEPEYSVRNRRGA